MYDLHSKFDIAEHKSHYYHYLEVVILEDGTVEYAVPSHQEKLIEIACEQLQITRQEVYDLCPPEYHFDVITWLCKITNCVSVWTTFYQQYEINDKQKATLKALYDNQIYEGEL